MTKKTIQAEGLTPGINYVVQIFSTHTDNLGQTIVSKYSAPIGITTPGVSAGGGNLSATNFKTDMRLAGGSFYVGSFKGTKGVIALVDNLGVPITLTSTESGLIINKYGIAAYNAGVPEFTLDAVSGRAIFAGRVQAGTVKIGPKVDPTGTKNGIYINTKNYWYDDGTFKVNAKDVSDSLEGSDPVNPQVTPTGVTNFMGEWKTTDKDTLHLTWNFDETNPNNAYVREFVIEFKSGGDTAYATGILPTARYYDLTFGQNTKFFPTFRGTADAPFTSIKIYAVPKYGTNGPMVPLLSIPAYQSSLSAPSYLEVVQINNGYLVSYTVPADSSYGGIIVEETTTSPGTSGFGAVPTSSETPTPSPTDPAKHTVTVLTSNLSPRWVRAKFYQKSGVYTDYSPTYAVTPIPPITINTSAPDNVTVYSDSAQFQTLNGVAFAGTTIDIYFDMPSTNAGDTFVAKLTPSGISTQGYFYFPRITHPSVTSASGNGSGTIVYTTASPHGFKVGKKITVAGFTTTGYNITNKTISAITTDSPYTFTVTGAGNQTGASSGTGTALTQYAEITKDQQSQRFNDFYSSFTGSLISIGSNGVENSSPPSITVGAMYDSLTGTTPLANPIAVSNGYSATWSLFGTTATYAEVYQKYTSWASVPTTTKVDYYYGTGTGTSGTNLLTITSPKDQKGIPTAPLDGYLISGTNIPDHTFVSAVSGSGPYVLTLSTYNAVTQSVVDSYLQGTASGTYTANALVYSGQSPATIPSTFFAPTYVAVRFYDDAHHSSNLSAEKLLIPINAGAVDTTAPAIPTLSVYTTGANAPTYNSITVNIASADTSIRGYSLRWRVGSGVYTTIDLPIVTGTSLSFDKLISGLDSGTAYKFSVASYDQFNNMSTYTTESTPNTGTTLAATVNPPTNLLSETIPYGVNIKWTPPAVIFNPIKKYTVTISGSGSGFTTRTIDSYSNTATFLQLLAGKTYTVTAKTVDSKDVASSDSTAITFTLNADGIVTDGVVPPIVSNLVVRPGFKSLVLRWDSVSNKDYTTYEVHMSTSNNFTPGSGTLLATVDGNFYVINKLQNGEDLNLSTTYYVAIVSKDSDGKTITSLTYGSGIPSKVNNGDLAAGSITANSIEAGAISASTVDAASLLAGNKVVIGSKVSNITSATVSGGNIIYTATLHTFEVGELVNITGMYLIDSVTGVSTVATAFNNAWPLTGKQITAKDANTFTILNTTSAVGTAYFGRASVVKTNAITIDGATGTSKLYSGTGTFKGTTTPFYLDSDGQFSLYDKLRYSPNDGLDSNKLIVKGTIKADDGDFTGYMTVNDGAMKIGKGVNPINVPVTGQTASTLDGIHIHKNAYWYSNGYFATGASQADTPAIKWDGTDLYVVGDINAKSGSFTGNVSISSGAGFIAAAAYATITNAVADGTYVTYTTSSAHGLANGNIVSTFGIKPTTLNSTLGTVVIVSTTQFKVLNSSTNLTSSTSGGSVATTQVTLTNTGLVAYDALGQPSTYIYSGATNNPDSVSFLTKNARIGDWKVQGTKIENYFKPSIAGTANYTGLSGTGLYSFWAGSTVTGDLGPTTDTQAKFWVKPNGDVKTASIFITGNSNLDIGSLSYKLVTASIIAPATGTNPQTITLTSNTGIVVGQYVSHSYVPAGTVVTVINGNVITISNKITASLPAAEEIIFVGATGAHITSNGKIFASDSYFNGDINAKSGTFSGNIALTSTTGGIYSGTLTSGSIGAVNDTLKSGEKGFLLNSSGLTFNADKVGTTYYDGVLQIIGTSKDVTVGGSTVSFKPGTILAQSAVFGPPSGGWYINQDQNSGVMYSKTTAGTLFLDSNLTRIYAQAINDNYSVGFRLPPATISQNDVVIWAGNQGIANTNNAFYVQANGQLNASSATISGSIVGYGAMAGSSILIGGLTNASVTNAVVSAGSITYTTSLSVNVGDNVIVTGITSTGNLNTGGKVTAKATGTITIANPSTAVSGEYKSGGEARAINSTSSLSYNTTDGLKLYASANSYMTFDATNGLRMASKSGTTINYLQFDGASGFKLTGGTFTFGNDSGTSIKMEVDTKPSMSLYKGSALQGQLTSGMWGTGYDGIMIHAGSDPSTIVYPAIENYNSGPFGKTILLSVGRTTVNGAVTIKGLQVTESFARLSSYNPGVSVNMLRNISVENTYTTGTSGLSVGDVLLVLS